MEYKGVGNINAETLVSRYCDLQSIHAVIGPLHRRSQEEIMNWRLPVDHLRPTSNWSVEWGPAQDAWLLIGIWRWGFGAWEEIQKDPLNPGLAGKFFLDEQKNKPLEEGQTRSTPTSVHLVRRGDYLAGLIREWEENARLRAEQLAAQQRAHQAYYEQHGHYPPTLPSVLGSPSGDAGPSHSSAGPSAPKKTIKLKKEKAPSVAPSAASASDVGKQRKGTPVFTDSESESD